MPDQALLTTRPWCPHCKPGPAPNSPAVLGTLNGIVVSVSYCRVTAYHKRTGLKLTRVDKPTEARCPARLPQVLSTGLLSCNHRVGKARAPPSSEPRPRPQGVSRAPQWVRHKSSLWTLIPRDMGSVCPPTQAHPSTGMAVYGVPRPTWSLEGTFWVRTWGSSTTRAQEYL